jgi:hypothetical protein
MIAERSGAAEAAFPPAYAAGRSRKRRHAHYAWNTISSIGKRGTFPNFALISITA